MEKYVRLRAEPFLGRKFAVCYANPQLSFMAKRQKVQMQPHILFHSVAYIFQLNFIIKTLFIKINFKL